MLFGRLNHFVQAIKSAIRDNSHCVDASINGQAQTFLGSSDFEFKFGLKRIDSF